MKRLKIDILGVSEMRWPGTGQCEMDGLRVFYSGEDSTHHRNGIGIIITKEISQSLLGFIPVSDRVAVLKINSRPIKVNIVQIYAPTFESSNEDLEKFYNDIKKTLKQTRNNVNCNNGRP